MMSRLRGTSTIGIDSSEVMLRMLRVIFRGDSVPGRLGAGQRQVFFKQLMGIAANPDVGAAAVEHLVSIGRAVGIVMLLVVVVVATAAAAAATIATAARSLTIVWSH